LALFPQVLGVKVLASNKMGEQSAYLYSETLTMTDLPGDALVGEEVVGLQFGFLCGAASIQ